MLKSEQYLLPKGMEGETALHINKVRKEMEAAGIEALLVSSNVNLFYCTGRFFRGYVYIDRNAVEYFVVRPQVFEEKPDVNYIRKPEQIAGILADKSVATPGIIGLEDDTLTYNEAVRLRNIFPGAEFRNATPVIREARMVKTEHELDLMRADGEKQVRVYSKVTGLYSPGMTDLQLQIEIERALRLEGCLGFARVAGNLMDINLGSVLAGDNADNPSPYEFAMGGEGADTSLPGGANGTQIRKGETVMIDMNGAFNAYQTDMTRVWSCGDVPEIAEKAHDCSRAILRALEKTALPGVPVADLYNMALEMARDEGLEEYFMGHRQKAGFIGHGVGIELNEQPPIAPRSKALLKEGMTIALEPKFVIPGVGAVGAENTYVVRPDGLECLTPFKEEILPLY